MGWGSLGTKRAQHSAIEEVRMWIQLFLLMALRQPYLHCWMRYPFRTSEVVKDAHNEGGFASVPRGVFWSKSSKMARNSPTNTSKGYSGPPESIPMISRTFDFRRIFGRFEPGFLSTFFQNRTSKNRKSPLPGESRNAGLHFSSSKLSPTLSCTLHGCMDASGAPDGRVQS